MITSLDDLLQPVVDLIHAATKVPADRIIPADEGRGPPVPETDLFATYSIVPVRAYGQPSKRREATPAEEEGPEAGWTDWKETVVSSLEVMISVGFYNEGSGQAAHRLHNADHRASVRKVSSENGIGWRYSSEVRKLPAIVQAGVEARYQADIHVYVNSAITETTLRAAGVTFELEEGTSGVIITGDEGES